MWLVRSDWVIVLAWARSHESKPTLGEYNAYTEVNEKITNGTIGVGGVGRSKALEIPAVWDK